MAKKVIRPPARSGKMSPASAGRPAGARRGRGARGFAAGVLIVLGLGFGFWIRLDHDTAQSDPRLPPLPELNGLVPELRQALLEAQARATADHGSSERVAILARLYHANNFPSEAKACWQSLHAAQPREARWCYYLADLCRTAGDDEGLKAWFEQTVELAPDYAPAWLQWADLEFKTGKLEVAEHAYRQRLGLLAHDPYARFGLARLALQRGAREEGTRQIVELIRASPDFPSSHNIYAEILAAAGDSAGAAEQRRLGSSAGRFRAADDPWLGELRAFCFDAEHLIQWGEMTMQTKQGDQGKALFERALRLAPKNPRAYERLGAYFLNAAEPAKAVEILERGSQLPDAPELLFGKLCDAYNTLHDPAGELRAAEAGLRHFPQVSLLHNGRGHALSGLSRPEEALAAFRLAITCAPYAADPVANLGSALMRLGRNEEAKAIFKQALKLQPMYPKAIVLLASLEIDDGELDPASSRIHALYDDDATSPGTRALVVRLQLQRAIAAVRQEDDAGVERSCREGLALVPDSSELTGFLGAYYVQQGRLPEALKALELSHRLRPDDPRVTLSLGDVCARLGRIEDARRLLNDADGQARKIGEPALVARCHELLERLSLQRD